MKVAEKSFDKNLLQTGRQTDRHKHNGQTVYPKKSAEYQRQQNLNQNTFPHNVQRKYSSIINFDHWTSTGVGIQFTMPKYTRSFCHANGFHRNNQ